jgi:ABC-type dipeptide/oligopeptide/nickel transport system permease subunit
MTAWSHPGSLRVAQGLLACWLALGVLGLSWTGAPPLLVGFGNDALALGAVLLVALLVGAPLGAVAGAGPRWVDATLAFTTDWIAAVPVVLLLAFLRPTGVSHFGGLVLLGVLRSLEVAWVVRSALLRAARIDTTWAARSLGYMPLRIFLRDRLPAAAGPALAHLALTPVWIFVLDSVGARAGLGAASSERGLGALLVRPDTAGTSAAVAVCAVVFVTIALHRLGQHYGLRLARK